MIGTGFIILPRSILSEPWYQQEIYDKARAFIDLVMMAAHKPYMKEVQGINMLIGKGQLTAANPFLARRWGWSVGKVRRFLRRLEAENLAKIEKPEAVPHSVPRPQTLITICEYERYTFSEMMNKKYKNGEVTPHITPQTAPQTAPQTTPQTVGQTVPQTVPQTVGQTVPNTRQLKTMRDNKEKISLSLFQKGLIAEYESRFKNYVTTKRDQEKIPELAAAISARLTKLNPDKKVTDHMVMKAWRGYLRQMDEYYIGKPMHYVITHIEEIANKIATR